MEKKGLGEGDMIQLEDMGFESHIGSAIFCCGIYKFLGALAAKVSFCGMVFPRFLSIGIRAFHRIS